MGLSAWRRMRLRERVLLWLLPALVFRALIPVGFMPGAGSALALELCSSAGFGSTFVVYDGGAPTGNHGGGSHEPCAFAAGTGMGPAPEIAAPTAAVPVVAEVGVQPAPLIAARDESLRPPPRAPPRSA